MNESEFRDWARNYLRTHDERIRKIEKAVEDEIRASEVSPQFRAGMAQICEDVAAEIKAGRATALGVAMMTQSGPRVAFAVDTLSDQAGLIGALHMLGLDVGAVAPKVDPVREAERIVKEEGGKAAA